VRGRGWILLGLAAGIAIAAGDVAFVAGAARALADTLERIVGSGGHHVIRAIAKHGAPKRVVQGLTALIAILLPGLTALLLIVAAKGTARLRALAAVVIVIVGVAGYAYHPHGIATGTLTLALVVAGAAVAITGPIVVAPLAAMAGLIGAEFLPQLFRAHSTTPNATVRSLHQALFGHPGAPLALRVVVVIVAAIPFALAGWLVVRR
jgi:hypothetical protein